MAITITADARRRGTPLHHHWSTCVGAGRANEGLRASWLEQLSLVHQHCGFRYVRFHGLFHDDMFVYRENGSHAVYNFQYLDDLFDRLLQIGVRPFVELGLCPRDLASQKETVMWWKGHGSPPRDYARWAELVDRTIRHCVHRYGIEEVRNWYFEVWNEPNLDPFWKGTRSQYFELYKVTVTILKAINGALRVGGPATSNFVPDARFDGETENTSHHETVINAKDIDALEWRPVWVESFLDYCHREHLPVDFVSTHPYPTDWALDTHGQWVKSIRSVDATRRDMALLRKIIGDSPYPRAQIHLTEWSSSPSSRDHTHDYLQAATFVVRANLESAGMADSLSYWTFTDIFEEQGAGDSVFHGGFGMVNFQGVVKPTFHAYRFLNALGDDVLSRSAGAIVTRHSDTGRVVALAYHYPAEESRSAPASFDTRGVADRTLSLGKPERLAIDLAGLPPSAPFTIETLDRSHGNAIAAWTEMGRPEPPTREQVRELRSRAMTTKREPVRADASGRLRLDLTLDSWAVVLLSQE